MGYSTVPRSQTLLNLLSQSNLKLKKIANGDYTTSHNNLDCISKMLLRYGFDLEFGNFNIDNCSETSDAYKIYEDQIKLVGLMFVDSSRLHIRSFKQILI